MHKRWMAALLTVLLFLCTSACAETAEKRVFLKAETESFSADEELLTLYVCPLTGADCMFLTDGVHTILVDSGKQIDFPKVHAMLEQLGITHIDRIFNSHPHSDHIGGVIPLLEAGFSVGEFITVFPHDYTGNAIVQRSTMKTLEAYGIPVRDMKDGEKIPFGNADITLMRHENAKTDNDASAMLMVRYGNTSMLLTADVEYISQWYLIKEHDMKADLMKFPHHAVSRMNPEFLAAVDPEFVFITHGSKDTKNAQQQLTNAGIPFRFATWGMIEIQGNGEKWIVTQE